ncbi:unnamed protein product [Meganyctiphanes norvegica]|uniref:RRM domain-containing protein n=1 Tax=Meganyctiphanes norvegica TaxID=48144 RepID=A0AAV2S1Z7_MEGNR
MLEMVYICKHIVEFMSATVNTTRAEAFHPNRLCLIWPFGLAKDLLTANNRARTKEVVKEPPGLYVRNVPLSMTNDGLSRLFSEHGKVCHAFVGNPPKDTNNPKHTWGKLRVENMRDAMRMIGGLSDRPPLKLKVEIAMTTEDRERRRNQKVAEAQHSQETKTF